MREKIERKKNMPRKRKFSDLSERCRFCLSRETCVSQIFLDWLRPKIEDLEKCSSVQIVDTPNYPKNVCYVCLYKLEMWNDFKQQFLKTNKTLVAHFRINDQLNQTSKTNAVEDAADDVFSDNNKKRPKICDNEPAPVSATSLLNQLTDFTKSLSEEFKESKSDVIVVSDANTEKSKLTNVSKLSLSDTSSIVRKKVGRPKKVIREASTKRWVERKNALIAATGELSSESESDGNSQLSPVQKARAKSNVEKELERKRSNIAKALRNLETNMTAKYTINQDDIVDFERKTRSHRINQDDTTDNEKKIRLQKANSKELSKSPKSTKESNLNLPSNLHNLKMKEIKIEIEDINSTEKEKDKSKQKTKPIANEKEKDKVELVTERVDDNQEEKENKIKDNSEIQKLVTERVDDNQEVKENKIKDNSEIQKIKDVKENNDQVKITEAGQEIENVEMKETEEEENIEKEKQDVVKENIIETDEKRTETMKENIIQSELKEKEVVKEVIKELEEKKNDKEPEKVECNDKSVSNSVIENVEILNADEHVVDNDSIKNSVNILKTEKINEEFDTQERNDDSSFNSQLVTSEVTLGNSTYIVTAALDVPDSATSPKSEIALKTNEISIDATNNDGEKIDIMNAVQLQRVLPKEDTENGCKTDLKNCLKIEIEGMEVEALQRVQLEVANFVNDTVSKRILHSETTCKNDTMTKKFKDSYENLDHQLKSIIEKVVRSNYEAETGVNKKIPSSLIKKVEKSSLYQPKVSFPKLNIGKLCKTYRINNLHILEDEKRKRGIVGPLSRTLGKRQPVLPKKYDGFSLTLKPELSSDESKPSSRASKHSTPKEVPSLQDSIEKVLISSDISPKSTTASLVVTKMKPPIVVPAPKIVMQSSTLKDSVTKVSPQVIEKTIFIPGTVSKKTLVQQTTPNKSVPTQQTTSCTTSKSVPTQQTATSVPTKTVSLSQAATSTPLKSVSIQQATPSKAPVITTSNRQMSVTTTTSPPIKRPNANPVSKVIVTSHTVTKPVSANNSLTTLRQRHICGICGKELLSKEEAEAHVKSHKTDSTIRKPLLSSVSTSNTSINPTVKPKPKLLRCRRCQTIVEARHVTAHNCNSIKYSCTLCECPFDAEHLLIAHVETHAHTKEKYLEDRKNSIKASPNKDKTHMVVIQDNSDKKMVEQDLEQEPEEDLEEMLADKDPQGYSCFVCDKVFVDEDQMKDHLQMHCEEVSDDGNEKGFQCAFCGEKFQSEESLETHVGNHLLEDGDEKINLLISMDTKRDKKRSLFRCEQCSESFTSSLLLAMHLPIHDEETGGSNEFNQQDVDEVEHHVCNICDEIFETADELYEHQDVHNGNTHVCILCEKSFSSIRDLQAHVPTHL